MKHAAAAEFFNAEPMQPARSPLRIPVNLLGKILDHGKVSAHAAHLLAIKCSKGPGFVLNEHFCRRKHGIGRKAFRAGIRLLKHRKVLDREQPDHHDYAVEKLIEPSIRFIAADEHLLDKPDANLIAFVLAINLSPAPIRPEQAARRIGVKSRPTIRKLTKAAIAGGWVEHATGAHGQKWLARKGVAIDLARLGGTIFCQLERQMEKKVPAKKVPTHSYSKEGTESESEAQKLKAVEYGTRPGERGETLHSEKDEGRALPAKPLAPQPTAGASARREAAGARQGDAVDRVTVLADWKRCDLWRKRDFVFDGVLQPYDPGLWRAMLADYGGAPEHVCTPAACRQALEIAHELLARCEIEPDGITVGVVMQALAHYVAEAHFEDKPIRSLAFIVEPLVHRVDVSDGSCLFDIPTRFEMKEFEVAARLAEQAVHCFETRGYDIDCDMLLSTAEVEILLLAIRRYGVHEIIFKLQRMLRADMLTVNSWRDFEAEFAGAARRVNRRR